MASKKKASSAATKINPDNLRKIWTQINADSWKLLADEFKPGSGWHFKGHGDLWGKCPYHEDPKSSFHIRFEVGYAKCFGCNAFENDPIAFASKLTGKPYTDAFSYIYTKFGLQGFNSSVFQEIQTLARRQELKRHIANIVNRELVDAASVGRSNPDFAYAQPAVNYLDSRRIPLDNLHKLPLGVVPSGTRLWERIKELEKSTGQSWAVDIKNYLESVVDKSPVAHSPYEGWLVFINHLSPTAIGQFRVRSPDANKHILVVPDGDNDNAQLGFFGLGQGLTQLIIGNTDIPDSKHVVLVEGEFDALAAIVPQVVTGNPQVVVCATGGKNNTRLDGLASLGFEEAWLAGDNDSAGVEFVKLRMQNSCAVKTRGLQWPSAFPPSAKDLHDCYMALGGQAVVNEVAKSKNYLYAHQWMLEQLASEKLKLASDDVSGSSKIAVQLAEHLTDATERATFLTEAAELLGVDSGALKSQIASTDTEEGFIRLLTQQLAKEYKFCYKELTQSGSAIVAAWNRRTHTVSYLDLSKNSSMIGKLQAELGSLVSWIIQNVGEPVHLKDFQDDEGNVVKNKLDRKEKEYEGYICRHAIPELAKTLPTKTGLKIMGPGVHVKDITLDDARKLKSAVAYFINGDVVCKAKIRPGHPVVWEDVEGIVDGEYLFEFGTIGPWSKTLVSAAALNSAPKQDLASMFQRALAVFDTGWLFNNHELEVQYLAALIFALPISKLFSDFNFFVYFNAQARSGKTNMTLRALSGDNSPIRVLECSHGTDNPSEAGIRALYKDASITCIIDEFEVGDSSKYRTAKQTACFAILEMMRGSFSGGTEVVRGSSNGKGAVRYSISVPFIISGIATLMERADISRFNVIEMATRQGQDKYASVDTENTLLRRFTGDQIAELRNATTLWGIQNMELLKNEYEAMKLATMDGQYFDRNAPDRLQQSLKPIMAIMKLAGWDYKKFALAYTKAKAIAAAARLAPTESEEVMSELLHSGGIKLNKDDPKVYTVAQILSDPHIRDMINDSGCGVYYVAASKLVFIIWENAKNGALRGTKYDSHSTPALRMIMQTNTSTIPKEKYTRDSAFMVTLRKLRGTVSGLDALTVMSLDGILGQTQSENQPLEASFVAAATPTTPLSDAVTDNNTPKIVGDKFNV